MCQRNKLKVIALLGALIVAGVFISGCTQVPEEKPREGQPSVTTPAEKSTIALPKGSSAGKIAFTLGGSVYVINYDGTGKLKLAEGSVLWWAPDGKRIVYRNGSSFYAANFDGTGVMNLGTDIPKELKPKTEENQSGRSPDGKKIASVNSYNNLVVSDVDESNLIRLKALNYPGKILWSPGKKIIYQDSNQLYAINPDGTGDVSLGLFSSFELSIIYSPDGRGRFILYSGRCDSNNADCVGGHGGWTVRDLEVTNSVCNVYSGAKWSPDGKKILSVKPWWDKNKGKFVYDIYVTSADCTGRALYNNPTSVQIKIDVGIDVREDGLPKWSSDSKKIVYTYTEKFGKEVTGNYIYVVNADGTGKIKLAEGQNPIPSPATK